MIGTIRISLLKSKKNKTAAKPEMTTNQISRVSSRKSNASQVTSVRDQEARTTQTILRIAREI